MKCSSMKDGGIHSSLPLRADDCLLTLKPKERCEIKLSVLQTVLVYIYFPWSSVLLSAY